MSTNHVAAEEEFDSESTATTTDDGDLGNPLRYHRSVADGFRIEMEQQESGEGGKILKKVFPAPRSDKTRLIPDDAVSRRVLRDATRRSRRKKKRSCAARGSGVLLSTPARPYWIVLVPMFVIVLALVIIYVNTRPAH